MNEYLSLSVWLSVSCMCLCAYISILFHSIPLWFEEENAVKASFFPLDSFLPLPTFQRQFKMSTSTFSWEVHHHHSHSKSLPHSLRVFLFISIHRCVYLFAGGKRRICLLFYWHKYMIMCYYSFISLPANNHFYV